MQLEALALEFAVSLAVILQVIAVTTDAPRGTDATTDPAFTQPVRGGQQSVQDFLDDLLSNGYDGRVRPFADDNKPVTVTVDIRINSISSINELQMDYSVNTYFRQRWTDPRLSFTRFNHSLTLNYNQVERIWVPDTFVSNEKEAKFHDITTPNRLLRIWPDGKILYSQRLSLKLGCPMDLQYFPVDNQSCAITLESYGYTTRDIILIWTPGTDGVEVAPTISLPEFSVSGFSKGDCTAVYSTGSFTCIYGMLYLERAIGFYLTQTYIPSILVVILSWVAFWIDNKAVPARVTLSLLTVLTITTQSSGVLGQLPRVSYVKAIDVWMATCLVFVVGGLLEYALVNVLSRKVSKYQRIGNEMMPYRRDENDSEFMTPYAEDEEEDEERNEKKKANMSEVIINPDSFVARQPSALNPNKVTTNGKQRYSSLLPSLFSTLDIGGPTLFRTPDIIHHRMYWSLENIM
ncbi:unnamed protein product [Owenia fusiformis]|uniref:Uncharacterized protein n=1 Tax=Owenia fusiformis TaxID=6347 RepID=A0A8S4N6W0_OWEFU|nr:unnamed protein product [Owenia fusiformis]